ncbi:MAG: glutamyl-tRNA reductase [Gemmatimonadota bacterium]|nr:glutamyl-tRNA reductase [Gemmatimonadota bacterium]
MSARRDELVVVGLSHRTAPIEVRERFSLQDARLDEWVEDLASREGVAECVVLSTCNRTECYVTGGSPTRMTRLVGERLSIAAGLEPGAGQPYLRSRRGFDAVRHLFRVVGGLDSLVIGEPQIQGQVSQAYHEGGARVLGPVLHRLFQSALAAGGRIRSATSIGEGRASIPSAAVGLARKVFGSLERRTVLVLGTGDMGQLTVRCLRSEGVERVYVASRNPARAERVGRAVGGIPVDREAAFARIAEVDLLVTCTDAQAGFVSKAAIRDRSAGSAPLVILDIALPRNVDPAAAALPDVFLYNIDDLQRVVDRTQKAREVERERAEAIVDRHAAKYWAWYRARAATPAIRGLRETAFEIVESALEESRRSGPYDPEVADRVRLASRTALNRILHAPTLAVRRLAERSDAEACLEEVEKVLRTGAAGPEDAGTARAEAG